MSAQLKSKSSILDSKSVTTNVSSELPISSDPRHNVVRLGSAFAQDAGTGHNSNVNNGPAMDAKTQSDSVDATDQQKQFERALDEKLVKRVQKGDKKAFDLLVVKHQSKVASVVSRYLNDYHEIADVTQEAFIKAYRAINTFRGDSAFYTWMYRIAINCAKNYLVARSRRAPLRDIDVDDPVGAMGSLQLRDQTTPESELSGKQLEVVVHQAISNLAEDLRVAFTLREFDGLSYEEIAQVMDCPVGTVRSRIFRARESVDQAVKPLLSGQ